MTRADHDEKSLDSIALCTHSDTNKATQTAKLTTEQEEKRKDEQNETNYR